MRVAMVVRCGCLLALLGGLWGPLAWGVQLRDLAQPQIVRVLVPMQATEAKRVVQRLIRAGATEALRAPLEEYFQTKQLGNSMPLEVPTRTGRLCLALALHYDVDEALALAPVQDAATRNAIATFLLTHEAVHCASLVLPAPYSPANEPQPDEPELEGLPLLQEESLADQVSHQFMLTHGRAGYHASVAWQRYRLFGFLRGDLDHWTTPLVQGGLGVASEQDYRAMQQAWPHMVRALNRHADGSTEQAQAWQETLDLMPLTLRTGLPNLATIRALGQQLWPQAPDWRCAARVKRCATAQP